MKKIKNYNICIGIGILLLFFTVNFAFASSFTAEPRVQAFINQVATHYHFSPSYVKYVLNQANYNPLVIQKIETPYEAKPWYQYQPLFVTQDRIDNGIKYWNGTNKLIVWEEDHYAVPGSIVLAIVGVETKYGTHMGDFRVIDALTTLAFGYAPQASLFQGELASFIAMVHTYHMDPTSLLGSYAGAMGQCQFMPSSYLNYAVDFQDQNQPNLFSNKADVIFSVGNFLRQNGWEPNQPIAIPARIIGSQFQKILTSAANSPIEPTLTLEQLANYGVYPIGGSYDQNLQANLISFQGSQAPEYWLTFHNFYVLTRYNTSNLYALAVYELSFKLQQAWDIKQNQAKNITSKKLTTVNKDTKS